jgi:pimeloyl-ACP methyl ester carboxylesterase
MDGDTETLPGNPPCVVRHKYANINGIRLHYVEAGPSGGEGQDKVCLALHGFPEFWYSWRYQIPALAAAGFRVLAPDLRGYNLSHKPPGVASYRLEALTEDVAGLVAHDGASSAAVVGHDWGGGIAWTLAMRRPNLVRKLAVLNAPHPAAFLRELRRPGQLARSWYMFFFQLPWLPELLFRAGNYAVLERTLRRDPVRPGAFTEDDIRRYKEALSQPGALTAGINYYRAAFRHLRRASRNLAPITVRTLLIWGERDRYLSRCLTEGLERWVPGIRVERLPRASHWVQLDAPERVNELLIEFLRAG